MAMTFDLLDGEDVSELQLWVGVEDILVLMGPCLDSL